MKVQSTMYYGDTPIADCTWTLDDRARTTQQALAALSIEDHLRESLRIEHKIINEDEDEGESKKNDESESVNENEERKIEDDVRSNQTECDSDVEGGASCDLSVQDSEDHKLDGVADRAEVVEDRSESDS